MYYKLEQCISGPPKWRILRLQKYSQLKLSPHANASDVNANSFFIPEYGFRLQHWAQRFTQPRRIVVVVIALFIVYQIQLN